MTMSSRELINVGKRKYGSRDRLIMCWSAKSFCMDVRRLRARNSKQAQALIIMQLGVGESSWVMGQGDKVGGGGRDRYATYLNFRFESIGSTHQTFGA